LASSVEIVLPGGPVISGRVVSTAVGMSTESLDPDEPLSTRLEQQLRRIGTAPGRLTMASVVRAGESLGEALAGNRTLGREDRTVLGMLSVSVLTVAAFAAIFPVVVGWTFAAAAGWLGLVTGARAYGQARRARAEERASRQQVEARGTSEEEAHDSMRGEG
jgi:hypothetical protein